MVIGKHRDDLCQSGPDPDRGIDHQKYDQGQKAGKIFLRMQMQPLSDERFLPQTPLVSVLLSFRSKRQLPPGEAAPFQKICR